MTKTKLSYPQSGKKCV